MATHDACGDKPTKPAEVSREECEAILHPPLKTPPYYTETTERLARAHLELLDSNQNDIEQLREIKSNLKQIRNEIQTLLAERDELRSQKAALESQVQAKQNELCEYVAKCRRLESQLAESRERCDELRIAWRVTKEQLAEARKVMEECREEMRCHHPADDGSDDCENVDDCMYHALTAAIDAAGALRAKPEATQSQPGHDLETPK